MDQPRTNPIEQYIAIVIECESRLPDALWGELTATETVKLVCDVARRIEVVIDDCLYEAHRKLEGC